MQRSTNMAKGYKTKNDKHKESYVRIGKMVGLLLKGNLNNKVNKTEESSKI